ncbi:helix-turn-helix domain-containing protein [Desmospora activa]|uniref:Tetratricopeptide repeat protein n=1 Tax=Desmospora activa DSM 45169 TaxID=1121389 RepID=A0A2T4ZAW4_9BACL|nr:helix-turn-helix transcriptional regulator [Desmospora activa]PTM59022.1 tetratricopeptide repeat protein [Desmospora activa DSM 45169]
MKKLEIHELGEVIRKVRKDRGLRLEDLADDNISPATISNIERGMPHVSKDKAYYLLKKLEIDADQLPNLMMDEQEQLKELSIQLRLAQSRLEFGEANEALHLLNRLELEDRHPFSAEIQYLRGCCYVKRGNMKRAERAFQKGLHLAQYASAESNIEARCHLELGLCAFGSNELEHALRHMDSGIRSYHPVAPPQPVWYQLHCNRAVCLEQLGRLTESMQVVSEHWNSLTDADEVQMILTFYRLRSELSRRLKMWDEALQFAYEGEAIARRNHNLSSMFTFWTVIGTVHMDRQEWDKAEESFKTALLCEQKPLPTEDKPSYAHTYALLSVLLMQQDQSKEAYTMIEKAIQYGEEDHDALHLIQALIIQGHFYQSHDKRDQAIQSYRQALSLSQKHGYKKQIYRTLHLLAQCWDGRDEREFQNCMREIYRIQKEIQPAEEWFSDPLTPEKTIGN